MTKGKKTKTMLILFFLVFGLSSFANAFQITIDATDVDTKINIGLGYIPVHGSATYELIPGNVYSVFSYPGGYNICRFQINENGAIVYDESIYGGRVQGNGATTLFIPGHDITLDGAQVDTNLRVDNLDGTTNYGGSYTYRLPANDPNTTGHGYSVFSYPGGYDICKFWVNGNGTIGYDEAVYGNRAAGNGTHTLTIPGHDITLDGAQVDTRLSVYCLENIGATNYGGSYTYRLPANDPNTPYHGYSVFSYPGGYDICTFWVNGDGTIGYDETVYGGRAAGNGTSILTIPGHAITLDGAQVDTSLRVDCLGNIGATEYYGSSFTYRLPANDPNTSAHQFRIKSAPGGYILDRFSVDPEGNVSFDTAKYDGIFNGSGTSTLTAIGYPITVDGSNVDTSLYVYPFGYGAPTKLALPGGAVTYNLPANPEHGPTGPYALQSRPGGRSALFQVDPGGVISYDAMYDGIIAGAGASVVTAIGYLLTIDAENVSTTDNIFIYGFETNVAGGSTGTFHLPANPDYGPYGPYALCSRLHGYDADGRFFISGAGVCSKQEVCFASGTVYLSCEAYNPDSEQPITSLVVANPNPVEIGNDVSLTANVDDSETGNSLVISVQYSINGGGWVEMDGSFDSSFVEAHASIPSSLLPTPEVYQLCVRGIDEAGNFGLGECILLPVYDPEGGFVTGGGWIMSPAGAYMADPSVEGKANFGFVSKYKKGAATPTGNTEFQFETANLNFHSSAYQWMVVAGSKVMYKGEGTINGEGNFGFLLAAIDSELTPSTDLDLFRIKIWDKSDPNETVVYDNNRHDEAEDADPITPLGGGNIIIHEEKK